MEQPAFTKSRTPAGGTSAALSLRSNVVGTYGSPTNAPSLYTRRSTENCPPPGEGSFYLLKLGSRVPDYYSASLPIGTPRGCFFIWSNRILPKAGRLRAGGLHIIEGTQCYAFCSSRPGSPERCSPQERFPHKRPLPFYTHADRQRTAPRRGRLFLFAQALFSRLRLL